MNNKYIGILTSGGDASGMNAAIRAVTRTAIFNGFKIKGIYRGYEGLIAGEVKELTTEDVSSIIQRGGTILKTARSEAFTTPEGRKKAYEVIQKENISALIIIGGDGSLTGARIFAEEYNVTCIGLPGTIDNDLYGSYVAAKNSPCPPVTPHWDSTNHSLRLRTPVAKTCIGMPLQASTRLCTSSWFSLRFSMLRARPGCSLISSASSCLIQLVPTRVNPA